MLARPTRAQAERLRARPTTVRGWRAGKAPSRSQAYGRPVKDGLADEGPDAAWAPPAALDTAGDERVDELALQVGRGCISLSEA